MYTCWLVLSSPLILSSFHCSAACNPVLFFFAFLPSVLDPISSRYFRLCFLIFLFALVQFIVPRIPANITVPSSSPSVSISSSLCVSSLSSCCCSWMPFPTGDLFFVRLWVLLSSSCQNYWTWPCFKTVRSNGRYLSRLVDFFLYRL